jgi:hypothetical protein
VSSAVDSPAAHYWLVNILNSLCASTVTASKGTHDSGRAKGRARVHIHAVDLLHGYKQITYPKPAFYYYSPSISYALSLERNLRWIGALLDFLLASSSVLLLLLLALESVLGLPAAAFSACPLAMVKT